jgi:hypothetical protein
VNRPFGKNEMFSYAAEQPGYHAEVFCHSSVSRQNHDGPHEVFTLNGFGKR